MTSFFSALLWGALVLSLLVFIHEGGHYLAARACGIRVTEFFLGMPSKYSISHKSRSHGTVFGITPILLGGYTRICGMEGELDPLLPQALAIVQRMGRVSSEAVASELSIDLDHATALLDTLCDWTSVMHADPEAAHDEKSANSCAWYSTLQRDAHLLNEYDHGHDFAQPGTTDAGEPRPIPAAEVDAFFSSEKSRTYAGGGFWRRVFCLVAGPVVNLLFAFLVIFVSLSVVGVETSVNTNELGAVIPGTIAESVGLQAGDAIVELDGTAVTDWLTLCDAIDAARSKGGDFNVTYVREGRELNVTASFADATEDGLFGIQPPLERVRLSASDAVAAALRYGKTVGSFALQLIMPQHTMEVLENSSSVVGISAAASEAASAGLEDLVYFMAAVSMSLGFMNLLPIPPLDGGKILIELIQVPMGRPMSVRAQSYISYVGLAFFLFIFAFALKNDIARIFF